MILILTFIFITIVESKKFLIETKPIGNSSEATGSKDYNHYTEGTTTALIIDVAKQYGVTYEGLRKAILEAQTHFQVSPHQQVIIHITSGLHTIAVPSGKAGLDFKGTQPGTGGRLILEGEGIDNTVLEVDPSNWILTGRNIFHLTVRNIHFRKTRPLVSQGKVIETGKGFVVLALEEGFPDIASIYDTTSPSGRYLKKFRMKNGNCRIVRRNNDQIAWSSYTQIRQGIVKLHLKGEYKLIVPPYSRGDLVGIKSKCCGKGKSSYFFQSGDDLVFENVKWTRQSRGVFRFISNVRFTNIIIARESKAWCLGSVGGGPQLGQPDDPNIRNIVVDNLVAENTGDDSIGFFNVKSGGIIKNCRIKDSFARGILLRNSETTILQNNVVKRCPITYKN